MVEVGVSGEVMSGARRRRSAVERRRIVEETLEAGTSVARVALKYGVNANQVFQWRRLYRDGKLGPAPVSAMKLLPVSVVEDQETVEAAEVVLGQTGAIHIELPGHALVSVEGKVDAATIQAVLQSLLA